MGWVSDLSSSPVFSLVNSGIGVVSLALSAWTLAKVSGLERRFRERVRGPDYIAELKKLLKGLREALSATADKYPRHDLTEIHGVTCRLRALTTDNSLKQKCEQLIVAIEICLPHLKAKAKLARAIQSAVGSVPQTSDIATDVQNVADILQSVLADLRNYHKDSETAS